MKKPEPAELYTRTWVHPPPPKARRVGQSRASMTPLELSRIVHVPPKPRKPESGAPDFTGALAPVVETLERVMGVLARRDGKAQTVDLRFVVRCHADGQGSTSVSLLVEGLPGYVDILPRDLDGT